MAVKPPSNLPPDSQPWGREVDTSISQLQFEARKTAQDNANSFSAVNNALTAINTQNAQILAQNAQISAQNAQILAQQAQINSVLDDLIGYDSTWSNSSSATIGAGGWVTISSGSLSVPAGAQNAIVYVVSTSNMSSGSAGHSGQVRIRINGSVYMDRVHESPTTGSSRTLSSAATIGSPPTSIPVAVDMFFSSGSLSTAFCVAGFSAFAVYNK